MTHTEIPTRRPGRLAQALVNLFMKHATIIGSEPVGPGFQLITLESPQFVDFAWAPGQKVQIAVNAAFATRTYTPIDWDPVRGRTRIVGFAHGDGPGAAWVRDARPGDGCEVFGPRASLDLSKLSGSVFVFGDETSFGLAVAIAQRPQVSVRYLFEVNAAERHTGVLARLDLTRPELFPRRPGDAHLRDIEAHLADAAALDASFVLTGKAGSIQRLRGVLRALNVPSARIMTKAYWAPGKTGLD